MAWDPVVDPIWIQVCAADFPPEKNSTLTTTPVHVLENVFIIGQLKRLMSIMCDFISNFYLVTPLKQLHF